MHLEISKPWNHFFLTHYIFCSISQEGGDDHTQQALKIPDVWAASADHTMTAGVISVSSEKLWSDGTDYLFS